MSEVKICGLKYEEDIAAINEYLPEYIGMVMFCPKSSRCVSPDRAAELAAGINSSIKKVAVVVSPDKEQICEIERIGFDMIQIHGSVDDNVLESIHIPIIRAINVAKDSDEEYLKNVLENVLDWDNIYGVLFDAGVPGSGETFDWNRISVINDTLRDTEVRLFLAGGLNPENVSEAVRTVKPDVVDVSSGVEYDGKPPGSGKDKGKIERFIQGARTEC